MDRQQVPTDVQSLGYRQLAVQNLRLVSDNVRYRLVLRGYFESRMPEEKIVHPLNNQGVMISAGVVSNILTKKHLADVARGWRERPL